MVDHKISFFHRVFFSAFVCLVIISSFYEIICNFSDRKTHPVLSAFSVCSNAKAAFSTKSTSSREITFLHGIRAIAIVVIVFGHTCGISFFSVPMINSNLMYDFTRSITMLFLTPAYFGVDTFFMLSSMLLTLSVFRQLQKT